MEERQEHQLNVIYPFSDPKRPCYMSWQEFWERGDAKLREQREREERRAREQRWTENELGA